MIRDLYHLVQTYPERDVFAFLASYGGNSIHLADVRGYQDIILVFRIGH
jgi:hypothetical protein